MKKDLQFRPYATGDEDAILELFQSSFGRQMSKEYWFWRFRDNPVSTPQIELCWDGEVLAGHYAVSPVILAINHAPALTALSLTTMTHPDYRGLGLFPALAKSLYSRLRAEGFAMVWGFPNDQSHRGFIRDLGWKDVSAIPMFTGLPSDAEFVPDGHIVECRSADELKLDESLFSIGPLCVQRNVAYIEWRFLKHPHNHYRILTYQGGGNLLGYIVFKTYQDQVDIVDLAAPSEAAVALKLVKSVVHFAAREKLKSVNMWMPLYHPLHTDLERIGFHNGAPVTYFGVYPLRDELSPLVCQPDQWYLTLGDSDVF